MIVPFDKLETSDLIPGTIYKGGVQGNYGDDPLSSLFKLGNGFKGIQNKGGIRRVKVEGIRNSDEEAYIVLVSTGKNKNWPDYYNEHTKILTYYGDNETPGNSYLNTHLKGNLSLQKNFELAYGDRIDRTDMPPFFYFKNVDNGRDIKFIGVALPVFYNSKLEDVFKLENFSNENGKYINVKAHFKIVDDYVIQRNWLYDLKRGNKIKSQYQPPFWDDFIEYGPKFKLEEFKYTEKHEKQIIKEDTRTLMNRRCSICNFNFENLLISIKANPDYFFSNSTSNNSPDEILFCPNHRRLFDLGLISFDNKGKVIISDDIIQSNSNNLHIDLSRNISLNDNINSFLKFHRKNIFKGFEKQKSLI